MAIEKVLGLSATGIEEKEITTGGGGKEIVSSTRTYYIRTDGSDSNDGLANTSGGAWLTIQHAVDFICLNLIVDAAITVQVADGTYVNLISLSWYEGKAGVTILGNTSTPSNVLIQGSTGATTGVVFASKGNWLVRGVKIENTNLGSAIRLSLPGTAITFGECVLKGISSHAYVSNGARCTFSTSLVVEGSIPNALIAETGAFIECLANTLTFTGTTTYSDSFAKVSGNSLVLFAPSGGTLTVTGTMSGPKYKLTSGGKFSPVAQAITGSSAGTFEEYEKGNILGTVSQSSGVPTGAIIERGSNANGEYVKFADGTLICTAKFSSSVAVTTAYGAGFFANSNWTYPVSFLTGTTPKVAFSANTPTRLWLTSEKTITDTTSTFYIVDIATTITVVADQNWIAIGRWY